MSKFHGFPGLCPGDLVRVGEFEMRVSRAEVTVTVDMADVTPLGSAQQVHAAVGPKKAFFVIEGYDVRRRGRRVAVDGSERDRAGREGRQGGGLMAKKTGQVPTAMESHRLRSAEMKREFIRAIAEFLGGTNQALASVCLQLPGGPAHDLAQHWLKMRQASPLRGYPTIEEAERDLTEFLS